MNTKYLITFGLFCFTFFSCSIKQVNQLDIQSKPFIKLVADLETDPVSSSDDAADDACIWICKEDVMNSKIIGTNKQEGLIVYDLNGKELFNYPMGKVNNVDIRSGFILNNNPVDLVMASNRTSNTISVHSVNKKTGELINVQARPLKSNLKEIYGFAMYKSPISGKFYAFPNGKSGKVEQWELFENNGKVDGKIVRTFDVGLQVEGIVADDYHAKLYIGEEEKALWKYNAEPNSNSERIKIIGVKDHNMKSDFEGVTIYDKGDGKGYIILSSQGNNSYALFDRISNQYLGSFSLIDGKASDGTYDTDGIDVTSVKIKEKFPNGFFIAQDGANTQGIDSLNQNFKIVDWRKISGNLNLK